MNQPLHRKRHPEDVEGCFGCKIIHVNFGIVASDSPKGRKKEGIVEAEKGLDSYREKRKYGNAVSIRRDRQEKYERRQEAQEKLKRKGILEEGAG